MKLKYIREFILGQGYVEQPPILMTDIQVQDEIESQGGQIYQNVRYEDVNIPELRSRIAELEAQRDYIANLLKQGEELVNEYAAENARLTAANESMQEDAVQNTYAFGLMLKANKAQAEEIRTLKKPCILFQQVGDK